MKKSFLTLGFVAAMAGVIAFNSGCGVTKGCTEPRDDAYNAAATEDDGSCTESATVAKFLGQYAVVETCPGGNSNFNITVTESSTTDYTILISNFAGVFNANVVTDISQDEITIDSQEPDNDDFLVEGSGSINGNVINMTYTVTNNLGVATTCQCTATKQ